MPFAAIELPGRSRNEHWTVRLRHLTDQFRKRSCNGRPRGSFAGAGSRPLMAFAQSCNNPQRMATLPLSLLHQPREPLTQRLADVKMETCDVRLLEPLSS